MLRTVTTVLVLTGSMSLMAQEPSFECLIEPWVEVRLGAETQGILQEVEVERGDQVTKGQLVARLVTDVQEATLALAKARAENRLPIEIGRARARYEAVSLGRKQELHGKQMISDQEVDEARITTRLARLQTQDAEVQHQLQQLELGRAEALVRQREIRSPIDGLVVDRTLVPGEYVTEGEKVVALAQINPLRVEAYLPLSMIGKVHKGSSVTIYPSPPVGGEYAAVVHVVDRVVDAASGTLGVSIRLENPDQLTLAGIGCRVRFESAQGAALAAH
ncbi:efflux RND transporter periplasmic adaptor subunit [Marinobacterium stanieri]|uniref:RND family efflux transporter, MFP subunit n=1 Tax=Marinobacterium stanieri TaxID=49186 RepID=A0A1N6S7E6_9GAMM|nr:efflux RND transporter periplasmic adaptor subunit [Marinobacterium stanieri]SIQ36927.1 RND family efflux transporter, MFP subunit [Marinobacterium stanieri]